MLHAGTGRSFGALGAAYTPSQAVGILRGYLREWRGWIQQYGESVLTSYYTTVSGFPGAHEILVTDEYLQVFKDARDTHKAELIRRCVVKVPGTSNCATSAGSFQAIEAWPRPEFQLLADAAQNLDTFLGLGSSGGLWILAALAAGYVVMG